MAPSLVSLRILLVVAMSITGVNAMSKVKKTNMSLYLRDISAGPNATFIPAAGISGKLWSPNQFGTVYVHDDTIRASPDPNSELVGRAQGMHVTASSDGKTSLAMINVVFTNKAYNGSTLQIYGTNKQTELVREVAVVTGSGKFRYAVGYAMFQTYLDVPSAYSVIQCNISIVHY